MARQPEERNLVVKFGDIPGAPEYPDVGIAIAVHPTESKVGKPVVLSGSYSADGALLRRCGANLAACVRLTVEELGPDPARLSLKLPLAVETTQLSTPSPGDFGAHYREGSQFELDLVSFFELPAKPAEYAVSASIGDHRSSELLFRIVAP